MKIVVPVKPLQWVSFMFHQGEIQRQNPHPYTPKGAAPKCS
jgi:hypothetical protein